MVASDSPITDASVRFLSPSLCAARKVALLRAAASVVTGLSSRAASDMRIPFTCKYISIFVLWKELMRWPAESSKVEKRPNNQCLIRHAKERGPGPCEPGPHGRDSAGFRPCRLACQFMVRDLFRKPVPTFRDHALTGRLRRAARCR